LAVSSDVHAEKLSKRASTIAWEANIYLPLVTAFQSSSRPALCLLGALRQIVAMEIDVLAQRVSHQVDAHKPSGNPWVRSYPLKDDYEVEAISWDPSPRDLSVPLSQFKELMKDLRTSVLDGVMDNQLYLKTGKLVHDRMSQASQTFKAPQHEGSRVGIGKHEVHLGRIYTQPDN